MSSIDIWSKSVPLTPLESLQMALPVDIVLSPKMSLKENISTVFSELGVYAEDHSPLPESKNLMSTWTAKNDQQLIQILVQNQDVFIAEGEVELQNYFNRRLKKVAAENPSDLWVFFTDISILFPKNLFWLPYFENQITQDNFDWSNYENRNWIISTLIPITAKVKSSSTKWNRDFLVNLFNLLILEKNSLIQTKNETESIQNTKSFLILLESIHAIFEMTDLRLSSLTLAETLPLQYNYYEFLQKLVLELEPNTFVLNSLINSTPSQSLIIESLSIQALILSTQQKKLSINYRYHDRIKNFVALYQSVLPSSMTSKLNTQGADRNRLNLALNSIFYLRTLLSLKSYFTTTTDPVVFTKGQWLTKNNFQMSIEYRWYDDLVKSLNDFLHLTQLNIYKQTLVDNCFKDNLETPTCQNWREKFPMKLKEILEINGEKRKVWEVISKNSITLPPGQITLGSHETLRIIAPEINFSFFSRIYAPSGIVEIQTGKLNSPWIDVSGRNGFNGFSSQTFPGQKPWIKKSSVCTARDYIDGVTLRANPRHGGKINWMGFSIKNPYPKNISVCASDAQLENRDEVGDITKMLDLGLSPEMVSGIQPIHGSPAGKISIEITANTDKIPLSISPLLVANGGDGSIGKTGQDSPLCKQGTYQSFKIILSHHKQWFQNWMSFTNTGSLNLLSRGDYGDHWYGLFEINLPRTSGSAGGDAGPGGEIELFYSDGSRFESKPNRWFLSSGIEGLGGKAGLCGPNAVIDGKDGNPSTQGKFSITKKQIARIQPIQQ